MKKRKGLWMTIVSALFLTVLISGCKDENVELVGVCPIVVSTSPTELETGVPLNKIITVTFNEKMNPLTITPEAFTIRILDTIGSRKAGFMPVVGRLTYNATNNTMSFEPTFPLKSSTTYVGTVTTSIKDLMGNALQTSYVWTFISGLDPLGVILKSADRFGIMAGVGISSNYGFSEIHNMDVGISPGIRSSITGFPPAKMVNGAIYASDDLAPLGVSAMLIQAKIDLTNAYLFAEKAISPAPITVSGDQGGKTLKPGIYKSTSSLLIQSGDLTLDAQGNVYVAGETNSLDFQKTKISYFEDLYRTNHG